MALENLLSKTGRNFLFKAGLYASLLAAACSSGKGGKDEPLVMWNFEEVNKPQEITYKIKGVLTEECLKQIESMGIADPFGIDLEHDKL